MVGVLIIDMLLLAMEIRRTEGCSLLDALVIAWTTHHRLWEMANQWDRGEDLT